jgi:hypothetical protein
VSVEDDAKERTAARKTIRAGETTAVGELRVVGEDGADAGENSIAGVAEELHFVASSGAGEPVRLVRVTRGGRWSEFAVDGECGFESDEWCAVLNEVGEGVIQATRPLFEDAEGDFDVCGAEFCDSLAADLGVGVLSSDNAAADAGFDERVGTGRGTAMVAAGLEGDVGGCSFCGDALGGSLLESDDLGVVAIVVEMRAFTDNLG